MSFEIPDELRFLETHEWARREDDTAARGDADREDGTARVGISDFAQDELGDVVFVEFPEEGSEVSHNEEFGVVESIKAVSDLYCPVSGTVSATNDALLDAPELVNEDPYGEGWILEVELAEDSGFEELLSAEAYREQTE